MTRLTRQWADATRHMNWAEANRLWPLLLAEQQLDSRDWNDVLRRLIRRREREDERRVVNDDEWDRMHGNVNQ